jgi:hypothetical protein
MRRSILFIMIIFPGLSLFAQQTPYTHTKQGEKTIISFVNQSGRTVTVSAAADDSYIVYRYGRPRNIEFEFPKKRENSWKQFTYSAFLRGGGTGNENMDMNYLVFNNDGFVYTVYQEHSASENKTTYGIRIEIMKTKRIVDMAGDPKTVVGSLADLKGNDKINRE